MTRETLPAFGVIVECSIGEWFMLTDALEITAAFCPGVVTHLQVASFFCQAHVDSAIYSIFKCVKSIITPEDIYMFVLSVSYHSWRCGCLGFFIMKIIFIL